MKGLLDKFFPKEKFTITLLIPGTYLIPYLLGLYQETSKAKATNPAKPS